MKNYSRYLRHITVLTGVLSSFSSFADVYTGVSLGYSDTEIQQTSSASWQDASPIFIQGQIGYFFSDYIGAEVRYGTSVERESDVSVDTLASVFMKGNIPVTDQMALYALAGYSDVSTNISNGGDITDNGISLGIGLHYAFNAHQAATVEFIKYTDRDNVRLNGLQIGFQYRF